jgi:SAM-dependent methyltransferase
MLKNLLFSLLPRQRRFERIHAKNHWGAAESVSGDGSTIAATAQIRAALPNLLKELEVRTILDAPCGDFNWMRLLLTDTPTIERYVGMDIVPSLIERNQSAYASDTVSFEHGDITISPLPTVDLIINRDCLLHLSFKDALAALKNFKKSGSKYLLTNTYTQIMKNQDIPSGRWRFINLELEPYRLPPPLKTIDDGDAQGKCMGLWKLQDL